MIKKAINKETGEEHKVLINLRALNANQMKLVNDIIAHFDVIGESISSKKDASESDNAIVARYADRLYRRGELKSAHLALRGKLASPYYIAKNIACKRAGFYDLKVFKLSAEASKVIELTTEPTDAPPAKKSAKKKKTAVVAKKESATPAKESKPRKELSMSKDAVRKREALAAKKAKNAESMIDLNDSANVANVDAQLEEMPI